MVQLKRIGAGFGGGSGIVFQFLYGTIKTLFICHKDTFRTLFQFLYGTIKTAK